MFAGVATLFLIPWPCGASTLPDGWRKALVSIEVSSTIEEQRAGLGQFRQIGTGFFVTPDAAPPFRAIMFTARHVLEGACSLGTSVYLRVEESPSTPDSQVQRHPLLICEHRAEGTSVRNVPLWVNHPRVDLAAIVARATVTQPMRDLRPFSKTDLASSADVGKWRIAEGEDVLMMTFYPRAEEDRPSSAIVRQGVIAEFQERADDFLISLPVFPGNSGSPVVLKPSVIHIAQGGAEIGQINPPLLLGVVLAYIPYFEPAISPQTGRTRVVFEENSGLTRVVRSERVSELLELTTPTLGPR